MDPVDVVLTGRPADLGGGFTVRRALPKRQRRMIGPFVFLDELGPVQLAANEHLDVPPHPHIGLATVTYLFDGELVHRDSLGTVQVITPGAVNWMTAGRGIVHSERTEPRASASQLWGVQTWVALPETHEEVEPSFAHHPSLPSTDGDGVRLRMIVGALHGLRSPVAALSDTLYADVELAPGARFELPNDHEERAAFVVDGAISIGDADYAPGQLVVFRAMKVVIDAPRGGRVLIVGGARVGPRLIWWNFVSSSPERIARAADDWRAQRFPRVPGETEFIPLPKGPPPRVRYP